MEKIRVLVCDDMDYMCDIFSALINNSQTCTCVGIAKNEKEVVKEVQEKQPDVILLDMQLDTSESGIILIPIIKDVSPNSKIIVVSIHEDNEKIFKSIQLGAKDYLFKKTSPKQIISKIESVYKGEESINSVVASKILTEVKRVEQVQNSLLFLVNKMHALSEMEMMVLKLRCQGLNYEQIAEKINVEPVTVRTYVSRILKKMNYSQMNNLIDNLNDIGFMQLFKN